MEMIQKFSVWRHIINPYVRFDRVVIVDEAQQLIWATFDLFLLINLLVLGIFVLEKRIDL